ncbi:MAG TPA: DUF2092 domain-containing protein [Dermatophilaceae bacterium]
MMNHLRPRRASYLFVAAATAVALSLSGCVTVNTTDKAKTGSAPSVTTTAKVVPTAKVLYDQMRKNVAAAKSVRMKGGINDSGKKITIDLAGTSDGKNTRVKINDGTAGLELLSVGGRMYIKADSAYWTKNASSAIAKRAGGKYVKVPATSGVMDDFKVTTLLEGLFKDLPLSGAMQKVEQTDVDGVPAYMLADKLSSQDGQIYVSADGKAQLMRIVSAKKNPGTLDLTDWNAVPPISAPPASQQVTVTGLS